MKSLGAGALLVGLGAGSAGAHPKRSTTPGHPGGQTYEVGPGEDVGTGTVAAYVTTNRRGKLSSVGVTIDADALAAFESEASSGYHLEFPEDEPTGPFTFVGFHWNEAGHDPLDVYGVPHFDFHFNFLTEATVEAIPLGIADYDVPGELMPANNVTADAIGQPRVIVPEMGEHLVDLSAAELQHLLDPALDQVPFTHTHVWGTYDPSIDPGAPDSTVPFPGVPFPVGVYSGDGEGETIFMEPMITLEFLQTLEEEVSVPINMPEAFATAGDYPTEYVMVPGHGGVYVGLDGFQSFPGPSV